MNGEFERPARTKVFESVLMLNGWIPLNEVRARNLTAQVKPVLEQAAAFCVGRAWRSRFGSDQYNPEIALWIPCSQEKSMSVARKRADCV